MTSHICAKHSTNVWFAILFHVFNGTPPTHAHERMRTKTHHKINEEAEEKINTGGKKKEKSGKESLKKLKHNEG